MGNMVNDGNDVYKVFTPTSPAILSFVERDNQVNNDLVDALRIPGMQIVLYGSSGAGKTTLLINKLNQLYENHIVTRCMVGMTMDQIILDGFDQLNCYYTNEVSKSEAYSISSELKVMYAGLKSTIEKQFQETITRILPIQLTAQRLSDFFGNTKCCWVLEDFHKIVEDEKKKLSQVMKIFMDSSISYPELKIIAIGAVNSARDVVKYDSEMKQRVSEIFVPLMSHEEIAKIIRNGEQLLNINFKPNVTQNIIKSSSGLPSVCHHLCLNMCVNKGIYKTLKESRHLNEDDFNHAVEKYVKSSSDTLKEIFEKAVKQDRVRRYNNPQIILKAMLEIEKDELTHREILNQIRKKEPKYPTGNLTTYLKQLQTSERGEILRFDKNAGRYSFSNPFVKAYTQFILSKKISSRWSELESILKHIASLEMKVTVPLLK